MLGRTRSAAHWLRVALALLAPVAAVSPFGGCGLDTQGSPAQCTQDLDCVTAKELCVVWRCEDLECVSAALPDGKAPTQIPGDCHEATCDGGKTIQTVDQGDADDLNPCTVRQCSEQGEVSSENRMNGDDCKVGQANGFCKDGVCEVVCATGDDCDDSNPCTEGTCDGGTCVFTGKHALILPDKDPHNCLQDICNDTEEATVPSLSETPQDNEECTEDTCVNGVPTFTPRTDEKCGMDLAFFCSPQGTCVGCNSDAHCGTSTDCLSHICVANECILDYVPAGTSVPGQTPGDCKEIVCDGYGNPISQNNNADPDPASDVPGDCQQPACSSGVNTQTPVALPASCSVNGGKVCNTVGDCVACNQTADCAPPAACTTVMCSNFACVPSFVGNGQMDPTGMCAVQPAASCGTNGQCNGSGGCRYHGTGTQCAPPMCANAAATPARFCNGAGTCASAMSAMCMDHFDCEGSVCATSCVNDGDCQPGYECDNPDCKAANGQPCTSNSECASDMCRDEFCCNENCGGLCRSCRADETDSSNGTCANITSGMDPDGECPGMNKCGLDGCM